MGAAQSEVNGIIGIGIGIGIGVGIAFGHRRLQIDCDCDPDSDSDAGCMPNSIKPGDTCRIGASVKFLELFAD